MKMEELKKKLKKKISDQGFDVFGFTAPNVDKITKKNYNEFLRKNYHGEMKWLERHYEKKTNPKKVWNEVKTVIVIGKNYAPSSNPLRLNKLKKIANISVYAQNYDYHNVINQKLKIIQDWLMNEYKIHSKTFVDTSPIMEKYFAQKAKIGWQGKHTNIVSKEFGSWLFLAEIFLPIIIREDRNDLNDCGTCIKCLDICPTNAILKDNVIDTRKCISYLTIEYKGPIPQSLRKKIGNKVYGCDDCLSICPWNKFSSATNDKKLQKKSDDKDLIFFLNFDEDKFNKHFANSPINRIGWIRFLRNIIIASGNSNNKNLIEPLYKHLNNNNPILRGSCVWSLFQLMGNKCREYLKSKLKSEKNKYVLFELDLFS